MKINSWLPCGQRLGDVISDAQIAIIERAINASDISELYFLEVEYENPFMLMEQLIDSMSKKTDYIQLTVKKQWAFQKMTETSLLTK